LIFLNKKQPNEIKLRIPFDVADKLRYALDHVQLTGDEHIDAVLDTLNMVIKEQIEQFKTEEHIISISHQRILRN